jgi:hypothetical protein
LKAGGYFMGVDLVVLPFAAIGGPHVVDWLQKTA